MKHFDTTLKQYAKSGYRSAEEWASLGRVVLDGASARIDTTARGKTVSLYTGDQTQSKRACRAGKRPVQAMDLPVTH